MTTTSLGVALQMLAMHPWLASANICVGERAVIGQREPESVTAEGVSTDFLALLGDAPEAEAPFSCGSK